MLNIKFLFYLLILAVLMSCNLSDEGSIDENIRVGIRIHNALPIEIDQLNIVLNTNEEEKNLVYGKMAASSKSEYQFVDELEYYHIGEKDYHFILSSYFEFDGKGYGVSSCFCDPDLTKELLESGKFTMIIEEIIEDKNTFYYSIEKD